MIKNISLTACQKGTFMSRAIANQLFVAFLGRPVDSQWLSATGNMITNAPGVQTTLGLHQVLYSIAVSEGGYVPGDTAAVYVSKIFKNVFGFAATTQEQTAWASLITNRTISTEAAPWVIFSSYLGSATVPQTYKFAAQYRLVLADTYTTGLTAADNLALASTSAGIATARNQLSGLNPSVQLTEAAGTLSLTSTLSSSLSVNLALDQVTLGTDALRPRSGNIANAVNVSLTQLTAETTPTSGSAAPTITLTGDDQANVLSTGPFATRFSGAGGNDTIVGNSGTDTIVFSSLFSTNGLDTIQNFSVLKQDGDRQHHRHARGEHGRKDLGEWRCADRAGRRIECDDDRSPVCGHRNGTVGANGYRKSRHHCLGYRRRRWRVVPRQSDPADHDRSRRIDPSRDADRHQ